MFLEAVVFIFITSLLYYLVVCCWSQVRNFPPGPRQLPLIGNLLDMQKFNHQTMRSLAKQFGGIYMITIMGKNVFVVANIDLAWEALVRKGNIFAGRPISYVMRSLYQGEQGLILGDFGPQWKLLRKVSHSALRMFGSGIESLEEKVQREADELCFQFSESRGVPFDPKHLVHVSTMNVICSCLFGDRYPQGDTYLEELMEMVEGTVYLLSSASLLEIFPFMKFLPLDIHKHIKRNAHLRDTLISSKFQERKDTYKEGTIRDLTDALIKSLNDAEMEDTKAKGLLNEQCLKNTLADVVIAGSETSASFLMWSLLYLAAFPEVQSKIHQQLDDVIGNDQPIRFKDRDSLPYLEATIAEVFRHSSYVYVTAPHLVRSNTTLGNYDIPENSQVLIDLRAIHHDPNYWRDPESFDPTRFLDEDGKFVCPATFSFLPFGAGPRGCLGQMLAKIEIFVFLAQLLRQFSLELPPGSSQPDLEAPVEDIVRGDLVPNPYKLCVTKRD